MIVDHDIIEQLRSRVRIRIMWVLGVLVSGASLLTVLWLVGAFGWDDSDLVELTAYVNCPDSYVREGVGIRWNVDVGKNRTGGM